MKKFSIFLMMLCFASIGVANAQQQSLPYSYGFESDDLSVDGWTTANPYNSNTSEFGIATNAKHNGDYGFRFSSYSRNNAGYDQYLVSPELDGARGVIMSFWYATSYSATELFKVGYSTTDTNISSFTWGNEISTNSTDWTQSEEFMFPAGTKYVAIWYYSNYQYRLYVDDFSFAAVPSCVKPTLSNEVILGMETASVQWTENGSATQWELQYSTNADFSGATTINRNGIPAYAIRDLSAGTTYYARVRANCGGGDYSDWSNVISFTTWACENATVVEYNLADSYGDGWNGNAIRVYDGCDDLVETLTIANGSSNSGTLSLCGDYYRFVWVAGSYANETSFTLTVNGTTIYSGQSGSDFDDSEVLHTIGTQPLVKPTALTAGTPGANEVQLSWTENGEATNWELCINGDESGLVVADSNPFTLTGLNAVTTYTVKVRSTDDTNVSCWSNVVSFTTDSSCPTPTNLTVTNLTPTSATLNWEGEADSYNVRYGVDGGEVTIFEDGFENGLDNWTIYTQGEAPNADGWGTFNASSLTGVTNHSGSYVASAWSWSGEPYDADNWLVTPQIDLQGTLKFWETTAGNWPDSYEVLLSTSGNSISDFTITLREMQQATGDWSEVSIDLSSYAGQQGYIAIHHVSNDANYLFIDDFGIYGTQDAGEWTNATSTTNSLDITGLTSLTNYVFQVQAVCGAEGESSWSDIANFTTPDACAVPTDLTAEVTGNTAELSWTGVNDTYNLQYREVDPTVPATIILNIPEDVWEDGSGYQMLIDADATAYGTIIPETGGLTSDGDASAATYAEFEYKLPTNADGSCSTSNILIEGSISIEIPAGTYDWCITNPTPGDRVWIASSNGNVGGRQDDYVFEPGMTYEFTIYVSGSNDAVDVTITDNNEWTLVEGVTPPYTIENLSTQTTYKYQVQGVNCDGNGGTTDWSASAAFTTPAPEEIILADASENDMEAIDGHFANVTLSGRTLYKDGAWNTLCLPFDVTISGSVLDDANGVEVKTLESSAFSKGTLTMNFSETSPEKLTAGVPYIIKWEGGNNIVDPVFECVTISSTAPANAESEYVDFVGTYQPTNIGEDGDEKHNLYLGSGSTLYYPTASEFTVNAFRGYFRLKNGLVAGEPTSAGATSIRAFALNFGEGEVTGIIGLTPDLSPTGEGSGYYDLQGRKLDGKPTTPGIYIHNRSKVVIK